MELIKTDDKKKPECDELNFSEDVSIRVNGKKRKGYYDKHQDSWHVYDKYQLTTLCFPTHWANIPSPPQTNNNAK